MNMKSWMMFGAIAALVTAQAMTYDEFKAAISAAPDGGTVTLENDVDFSSALPSISKRITIASPAGSTNTLRRAASFKSAFISLSNAAADLTFTNVAIDGNKSASSTARAIKITAGRLTLGAGAAIRNFDFGYNSGGIYVAADGVFVMNEGSEISGCDYGYGSHFGMILLGNRSSQLAAGVPDGVFEMNGGVICGNAGHSSKTTADYDGVIYLYSYENNNCALRLNGGLITGNTSDNSCAGICMICGAMSLGGDACITGNVGDVVNDMYLGRSKLTLRSGYKGRATFYSVESTAEDKTVERVIRTEPYTTGAGNVSIQGNPSKVICGYYEDLANGKMYWRNLRATVDGKVRTGLMQEAMAIVTNGGCVCIEQDCVDTGIVVSNGMSVTFRSASGERRTISRTVTKQFFSVRTNATLRIENLVLDGCSEYSTFFGVQDGACIVLGDGAEICNGYHTVGPCLVSLTVDGVRFQMEDGAVIRDCMADSASGYGALIRVGDLKSYTTLPCMEMRGGLITNCSATVTSAASSGYGGMIYVQNGVFDMSGGKIAGNTCGTAASGSCAGVQQYRGTVRFSGTARIENNTGAAPDFYRSGGSATVMYGDFRGHVGVSSGSQGEGASTVIDIDSGATGAWGFFPAANSADHTLVGTPNGSGKVAWTASTGWIDGDGLASAADAQLAWGTMALTLDERGIAALPHTFAGVALGVDSAVTLAFDPEALKSHPGLPLRLVSADGGAFTGTWNFTMPQPRRGRWYVMPAFAGGGVVGYDLRFSPPGMKVMIR